ncbi:poly polymerase catalytic domain containing protein [Phytophthora cinnamomi]|uniref:poly polymerase catalytic domain containing protein n=1 Tax=Phytophthora cinnamomi TaxID=4785 RepID=UPI00355951EA|nr:poly polymerase catalytic domain containing protein [Phytophthora cinnamomi]
MVQDANGVRWSFMLNLTDISYGTYGTNLTLSAATTSSTWDSSSSTAGGRFVVFRKWGCVGAKTPQSKVESYSSADAAEASFNKAFQSKSGNQWSLTKPFARKKGKYFLVELDDGEPDTADDVAAENVEEKELVPSKLPQEMQNIVQLICDPDVVTREMASLNVDFKRFPLGKLSKAQISQGYDILQRISTTLEELEGLTKAPIAPEKTTKAGGKGRRQAKAKAKAPAATNTKSVASYQAEPTLGAPIGLGGE